MKKSVIFFLLSFVFLASYAANNGLSERVNEPELRKEAGKDHPIVGKWEYVKTILPDGKEVINLIATEHYYSDGTALWVNVSLTPQPINEFSSSPEEIKDNYKHGNGGIGTYTIEKGNAKDKYIYKNIACSLKEKTGKSWSIEFKVDRDMLVFYLKSGDQVIFKRVADK
jgi:hypothetical protein